MMFESTYWKSRVAAFVLATFVLGFALLVSTDRAWAGEGDGLVVASASTSASDSASAPAKLSTSQLKAFKKASADFSLDLFGRCVASKGVNKNVVIAPMSIMNALAITANGSTGETRAQMCEVLGDGASMSRINKNMSWYNSKLTSAKKATLKSANAIWYHNDGSLKMKKKFLSTAKSTYNAKVAGADFSLKKTVDTINKWVAKQTNDMIKKIINSLDKNDRIAIVNALSFDAEWLSPYDTSSVNTATFTNAKGAKNKVDMMYGTEHTYIEGEGVTGFVKPYAKGYRYVAFLPDEGVSLKKFVKTLSGDKFRKLVTDATTATVHTALPKYSITYSNGDMAGQLADMGLANAFSNVADFSKMATDTSGNISLGSVAHKAKIDLDEQGTKAAAATAVIAHAGSAYDPDVKSVVLDRPFVYAIVDNTTKLPVFIGTVNDISK